MKLTVQLVIFSSINIFLSFLFQLYIVSIFGPGRLTDALFAGMIIPQLFLSILTGSLMYVLIPILSVETTERFSLIGWTFFQLTGCFFLSIALLLGLSGKYWVPLFVPGFDETILQTTIVLIRIQLISMIFTALISVLWSASHAKKQFVWVEISTIIANCACLIFLYLTNVKLNIFAAAWASVLKTLLQTILLISVLGKFRLFDLSCEPIKKVFNRMKPLVAGTIYYKSDQILDRFLASMATSGSLTLLHLAHQLYSINSMIFQKAFVTPIFPILSNKLIDNDLQAFFKIFIRCFVQIIVITAIAYIGVLVFGKQILQIIFFNFHDSETAILWFLLIALVGFLVCDPLGQLLSTTFYAQGDTLTPTIIGIFGYTLGLILKIVGYFYAGIIGLAIGTSIYYFVNVILMALFLIKKTYIQRISS